MNILIIFPTGNALNNRAGAETRIWALVSSLVDLNYDVSVLHSINSIGNEDTQLKKKVTVYYYKNLTIHGISDWYLTDFNPFFFLKLAQILRKQKFDIIQLEFPWGFYTLKFLSHRKQCLIYNSHGIENEFMKIATKNPKFPKFLKPFARIYAKIYEKFVCKIANIVITLSEIDRNYYIHDFHINKNKTILIQTPSLISSEKSVRTESLRIKSREKLNLPKDKIIVMFHGGLPHPPNREAFDIIEKYIAPNINNSEIIFALAGFNLEPFRNENIISLGFISDIKDLLYSADFAIMPIISGSGMRTKCMDYIMTALPFITTKKGIEGIDLLKDGEDYLSFDRVDKKFIDGINLLSKDKNLYQKIHENLKEKTNISNFEKFKKRFNKLYQLINKYNTI